MEKNDLRILVLIKTKMSLQDLDELVILKIINDSNIKDLLNISVIDKRIYKICKENKNISNRLLGYKYLKNDINSMSQKEKDETLLLASEEGNLDIVKFLIDFRRCNDEN